MNIWRWLTKKLPLEDNSDIMARVGFRFLWCTGPYFLVAIVLFRFGSGTLLASRLSMFILAIPFIGGVVDWHRLKHHTKCVETAP